MVQLVLDLGAIGNDAKDHGVAEFNVGKLLRKQHIDRKRSSENSAEKGFAGYNEQGNDGSLLMSVVASLEYRFSQNGGADSEDEEYDSDLRHDDESKPFDSVDENAADSSVTASEKLSQIETGTRSSGLEGSTLKKKLEKKNAKTMRKATKEEIQWFDDGVGFLAEDLIDNKAEKNDSVLQMMDAELEYDGFYVHRGPLLSEKRAAYFQKLRDGTETKDKRNSTKKNKSSSNADGENIGSITGIIHSSAVESLQSNKGIYGAADAEVIQQASRLAKRLHSVLEDQVNDSNDADNIKPRSQEEDVVESISKKIDLGLLQLVPLLLSEKDKLIPSSDRMRKLTNLHHSLEAIAALFPGLGLYNLEKHVIRVHLAQQVRIARKQHTARVLELREYVSARRKQCRESSKPTAIDWMNALNSMVMDNQKSTLQFFAMLDTLYFSTDSSVAPETSLEFGTVEWSDVLEKLEKAFSEAVLKYKNGKIARDHKMKMALCTGFVKRCVEGHGVFRWDTAGIKLLQRAGRSFKKMYLAATAAWKLEQELLKRRRTSCRSRRQEMTSLASTLWAPVEAGGKSEMTPAEVLAITVESHIDPFVSSEKSTKRKKDEQKPVNVDHPLMSATDQPLKKRKLGKGPVAKPGKPLVTKPGKTVAVKPGKAATTNCKKTLFPKPGKSANAKSIKESKAKETKESTSKPVKTRTSTKADNPADLPLRGESFDIVKWTFDDFIIASKANKD